MPGAVIPKDTELRNHPALQEEIQPAIAIDIRYGERPAVLRHVNPAHTGEIVIAPITPRIEHIRLTAGLAVLLMHRLGERVPAVFNISPPGRLRPAKPRPPCAREEALKIRLRLIGQHPGRNEDLRLTVAIEVESAGRPRPAAHLNNFHCTGLLKCAVAFRAVEGVAFGVPPPERFGPQSLLGCHALARVAPHIRYVEIGPPSPS